MSQPVKLALAGLGRMGWVHARNAVDLERTAACQIAALVDSDLDRARRFAAQYGCSAPVFASVEELAAANVCQATFVVTPTDHHRGHTTTLVKKGHRVLLEKPLTGTLEGDAAFAAELDEEHPTSVMLAFQRRFDPGLQYAQSLMAQGAIGRVFKIYSALEDSNPAPNGYNSPGILPDMSVHNVDEILWLTGRMPQSALAIGARIHSHKLTTCREDFDDALLYMWFDDELVAQVQVTRNHVSGYRVETIIFGSEGQIHVGRFEQQPLETVVEAYGRRGAKDTIARRSFFETAPSEPAPEFVDRFGSAYQAELAVFIECCRKGSEFPTSHRDGLRAQQVISAGMRSVGRQGRHTGSMTIPLLLAIALAQPVNEGSIGAGEGPAWSPQGELFFTGGGKISRRSADGQVHMFRASPNGANGLLFDHEGRLVACESQNRRITRTEADGTITVLASGFEGKKFNSPNDLTIDSRGRIYFSDPRYGRRDGMEMEEEGVYRIDAPGQVARVLGREVERANGVLVSPRDEFLYVADNNNNKVGGARKLWRFRLRPDGGVVASSRKLIFDWRDGRGPDGVKMDSKGRLFAAGGVNKSNQYESADRFKGGVYVLSPAGKLLEFIPIPVDEVTNCAFGGPGLKTLYVTAGGTLWSAPLSVPGRVAWTPR